MKKLFFSFAIIVCLASCKSLHQSATTRAISAPVVGAATAEMIVSEQQISFTYMPPKNIRRVGTQNCINAAIREALVQNGNADVLVECQEAILERTGLFGKKIKKVTITGYPAKYRNFAPVERDSLIKHIGKFPISDGEGVKVRPGFFKF